MALEVEGLEQLENAGRVIERQLAPAMLTERVLALARAAGEMLKKESVAQVVQLVYDNLSPEVLYSGSGLMVHGGSDDRTEDLMDAIVLTEEDAGFTQVVKIDENQPVSSNAHSGRELVIDYAIPVHDGYTQFVMGTDTGAFHPGRPWFTEAGIEATPKILSFIESAFYEIVVSAMRGI